MKKIILLGIAVLSGSAALVYGAVFWLSESVPSPLITHAVAASIDHAKKPLPQSTSIKDDSLPSAKPVQPTPQLPTGPHAHVLMYHYVRVVDAAADPLGYRLSVTAAQLDSELAAMQAAGYYSMTMADFAAGKGDSKSVVLTFDDGYEDFYTTAYPILQKYGWTATIYIISGKIGGSYMTWDQLRELKANGIEIGSHTIDHVDLAKSSLEEQRRQITMSKTMLEQELGDPVVSFCYPSGKYTTQTEQLVKEAGYLTATTEIVAPLIQGEDPFALPRYRISPSVTIANLLETLTY